MKIGKLREEREGSVTVYPLRPMQILATSVKAEAASETWPENVKGKMKKDEAEIAEIGIVPGIDPVTAVTGIEIGIGTGIEIGIEIGIGIGIAIVTIGEDHGPDHEIVMDIADVISTALDHGIVVAHAPKSEEIVDDQEAEVVRNVVQRATDRQNRMPAPTMTGHLVITRETEPSRKRWRPTRMLMPLLQLTQDILDMTTMMIKPDIDMRSFPPIPQLKKEQFLLTYLNRNSKCIL